MKTDKEILEESKKRFDQCSTYWSEYRQKVKDIARFISGDQWTYESRQNYENSGFAAITSNRIPTFLRQITNEVRKNTPTIQVDPKTDADQKKAELINDLIRNIQDDSMAEAAYCKAAENAASYGVGYLKISSKFKSNKSFDQDIVIESIDDIDLVMIDPNHRSIVGADMDFAFITVVLSKDEYKRRYGKSKLARKIDGRIDEEDLKEISFVPATQKWVTEHEILIVEYYFKDYTNKTLIQFIDNNTGQVHQEFDVPAKLFKDGLFTKLQEREVKIPVVRWCKINDIEVLEETEWPGEYIPLAVVKGDEYWLEGKRKMVGAVEPVIEAQVMLNYNKSWLAQLLQMAPKAPYIGTADQFKTYEQQWANINVNNQAFMVYNKDEGAPPPSRDLGELPIRTAATMIETAENDMRNIFGTFDPDNTKGQVESGKARLIRENQSFNSNYHFYDNLARAMEHMGCIIIQAIPVIYDAPREIQLLAQDGKKRSAAINQPNEEGVMEYDLTQGEYSVSIETGPSFGTKRQETVENILNMVGVYPESGPAIMDLAVRNMDWPDADMVADSLEALVPPQVLQARKVNEQDAAAMIPQLQAQLQSLTVQNQQMQAQLQDAAAKLQDKTDKVQIEQMKADVDMRKTATDAEIRTATLAFDRERTELEYRIKLAELQIAEQELQLQAKQLGLKGIEVASDIIDKKHDRETGTIDRIHEIKTPEIDEAMRESSTGSERSLE